MEKWKIRKNEKMKKQEKNSLKCVFKSKELLTLSILNI